MTTSNNASGSSSSAGSASSPSAASLARLEPWILLAKSARGVAAARIVFDATAAPGCYVFAELVEAPGVKELTNDPTTHAKTLALLDLFQFGTLADYRARPDAYPSLTPAHIAKLRHLTLVTLASQSRLLSYAHLVEALDLANDDQQARGSSSTKSGSLSAAMVRRLEDIIIEAVYAGLVTGKLDQKKMRFHVDSVMGRDVAGEEELRAMEAQLREWDETTSSLLSTLSDRINHAKAQAAHEARARQEHDHLLASTFHTIAEEQQQKQRDMLQSGQGAAAAAGFGGRSGPWDMSAHGAASAMMDLDAVAGKKSRAKRTRT